MKRILSLILICSVLLCGCGEGQTGSVPQSSSLVENSSSVPQVSSAGSNSSHTEDRWRWLTVEELNEVNKVFAFSTSAEYPAVRALLGSNSDYPAIDAKVLVKRVAERLCGEAYSDKFLDSTNPYLTADDTGEIEFLKNLGYDFEFDKISAGQLKYARITYEELDSYFQKYMGISCEDTYPESWNDNGYIMDGRQYGYGTKCIYVPENKTMYCKKDYEVPKGSFLCVSGRVSEDTILLYSEDPTEEILTMKKAGDEYLVVSIKQNSITPVNTYEANGLDIYDFIYKPKDIFLAKDSTKSALYNRAIDSFNDYLHKETENWHYPGWGDDTITGYCLYDFENDGIPELMVRMGSPVMVDAKVYTYVNGEIIPARIGDIRILENGMTGYNRVGTYDRYIFWKHNQNGSFDKVLTLEEVYISEGNEYYIDDVQVTKEEYHNKGDYYISLYDKACTPPYEQLYEEIIY